MEILAKDFMAAYTSGDKKNIFPKAELFHREIKRNEWLFRRIERTYDMSRALYCLSLLDKDLSFTEDEYSSIIILIYYCSLKNFLEHKELESSDLKYAELIGASELAFVIIAEHIEALTRILIGSLNYFPSYAQNHIRNHLMLFGGIVKDANEKHYHYFSDKDISDRFKKYSQMIYSHLPVGEHLKQFKKDCTFIVQDISKHLEDGFTINDADDFFDPFF